MAEEEKKEEKKCPECTQQCDCETLHECDVCGQVHCKNCDYEN